MAENNLIGDNLIGISQLQRAFNYKIWKIKNGETASIGFINGLVVLVHTWSNADSTVLYISTFSHTIQRLAGRMLEAIPMRLSFKGNQWDSVLEITSTYTGGTASGTEFKIAYQEVSL